MANPRNRRPGGNRPGAQPAPRTAQSGASGGGHGHDDERVPAVTTPQGYQTYGIGHKHEERDTNVGAVIGWFGRLAMITGATFLVVWVIWEGWQNYAPHRDTLPSQVFNAPQVPPEPRVLPQPAGDVPDAVAHTDLTYPWDLGAQEQAKQLAELKKRGLADDDGNQQLPSAAVAMVTGSHGGPVAAPVGNGPARPIAPLEISPNDVSQPMPSLSSGGTALENRLR